MIRRIIIVAIVSLMFFPLFLSVSYAENAKVYPKGVTALRVRGKLYFPVDERYNDNGDSEDIADDFNGSLDSSVFPALGLVEAGFGMPAGSATVGNSVVSMEYDFYLFDFYIEHGITDRLSIRRKNSLLGCKK